MKRRGCSTEEALVVMAIMVILAVVIVGAVDRCSASKESLGTGTVVQKIYSPSHDSSGLAVVPTSKGASVGVVSQHEDEKYVVIVKCGSDTKSVEVKSNVWGRVSDGDNVQVFEYRGKLTNYGWTIE